jgi:hypothetical protein
MLRCGFYIADSSVCIGAVQLSTHGELYLQGAVLTIFILIITRVSTPKERHEQVLGLTPAIQNN